MCKKELNSKLKKRLDQVLWSFYLCNRSLTELHLITHEYYNSEELKIVNSPTFNFYKVTLQYCFVMEYCKLLEGKSKAKGKANISSIERLNELFYEELEESFKDAYEENNLNIKFLQDAGYHEKIRALRNRKFAHSDADLINTPYEFKGFTEIEIKKGFEHFEMIKNVINNLTSFYDFQYLLEIPHLEKRTRNFVKQHAKYKSCYFRNVLNRNKG